jgi:hypothetical protein
MTLGGCTTFDIVIVMFWDGIFEEDVVKLLTIM